MASVRTKRVMFCLGISLAGNIASAVIKLIFGLMSNSVALLGDAAHSIFDSLSSIIAIYGIKMSVQPPDLEHPYGHSKFEYIATLGIVVMLFVACFNIFREAIDRAIAQIVPTVTFYSFASIITSLSISLVVAVYERRVGKATNSMILLADSSHTLTDVFASIVVIAGFVGTNSGVSYADPVAATLVSLLIAYIGVSMFRAATSELVDRGITVGTLIKVRTTVNELSKEANAPVDCHDIRGKVIGDKVYVDMHCTLRKNLSVEESHRITEDLEKRLKQAIIGISEVIIHVEPLEDHCKSEHGKLREKIRARA